MAFFSKWGVPWSAGPHSLLEMWQWFRGLRVIQSLGTQMRLVVTNRTSPDPVS